MTPHSASCRVLVVMAALGALIGCGGRQFLGAPRPARPFSTVSTCTAMKVSGSIVASPSTQIVLACFDSHPGHWRNVLPVTVVIAIDEIKKGRA